MAYQSLTERMPYAKIALYHGREWRVKRLLFRTLLRPTIRDKAVSFQFDGTVPDNQTCPSAFSTLDAPYASLHKDLYVDIWKYQVTVKKRRSTSETAIGVYAEVYRQIKLGG